MDQAIDQTIDQPMAQAMPLARGADLKALTQAIDRLDTMSSSL